MVPKAELHVHLEGSAPPDLVRRIAERNGLRVPDGVFASPDRFAWRDFLDFLQTYDMAASVIRTAEDYRDVTYEYLASCAAEGAVYIELIASPGHADSVGLSDEEHFGGIAAKVKQFVQALSRPVRTAIDWVIDKIAIGVTYDSDLEKARKLIKQIGLELQKDPEFAPHIIEPLKMQGVDALGDYAVQIRAKMMTVPGEQFVIRRKAYAMIKKAFDENGIKFAFPTVQVAGEGEPSTAAVARRALELTKPDAAA